MSRFHPNVPDLDLDQLLEGVTRSVIGYNPPSLDPFVAAAIVRLTMEVTSIRDRLASRVAPRRDDTAYAAELAVVLRQVVTYRTTAGPTVLVSLPLDLASRAARLLHDWRAKSCSRCARSPQNRGGCQLTLPTDDCDYWPAEGTAAMDTKENR